MENSQPAGPPEEVQVVITPSQSRAGWRSDRVNILLSCMRVLASDLPLNESLARVQELLAEIMPANRVTAVLVDDGEGQRIWSYPEVKEHGAAPGSPVWYDRMRHLTEECAHPIRLENRLEQNEWLSLNAQAIPDQVGGVVAAPLIHQGERYGALIVEADCSAGVFSEEDVSIIDAICAQLSLVISRQRAEDDLRLRTDQMAAFSVIASTINEWADSEQLARRFLSILLNATSSDSGVLYFFEANTNHFRLAASFGLRTELADLAQPLRLKHDASLQMLLERGDLITPVESAGDEATSLGTLRRLFGTDGIVVLPLRAKSRLLGFAALAHPRVRARIADSEFVQGLADLAAQAIENARLFGESHHRFEEQSALRELAQRFLVSSTPEEVLDRTLETLTALLPADLYEVLMPDNEGGFVMVNGRGWRRGTVGRVRIPNDPRLLVGYVLRSQSPVWIENMQTESRFKSPEYLTRHHVVSGLCAPMLAENRVIGLLGVYGRDTRQFSAEQGYFLYLVATQTAIALEKARHSQEAQRRVDDLALLNDVITTANSQVSLESVLASVTTAIGELLNSDDVQVYLPDSSDKGAPRAIYSLRQMRGELPIVPPAQRVAEWVVSRGEPLLIRDLERDSRFGALPGAVRSLVCVPMTVGERAVGVIAVSHPDPGAFDENDLRLLLTLAGQIAAAIERARLLDETEKRLVEMTALFEFSNAVRAAAEESYLVQKIVEHAVRILHADGGSVQLLLADADELEVRAVESLTNLGARIPRSYGGISWDVVESGESLVIADVQSDPRVRFPEQFEHLHGVMVVPLQTPTGILGALLVGFNQRRTPAPDQLRLLTLIANIGAQAIQRLRLHGKTVEQAQSLTATLSDLEQSYQATLLALSRAMDARDSETEGHSQRVTKLALAIGIRLGLSAEELTNLERGSLLHDVGKIGISDSILLKPGPLTDQERELMNMHPLMGYEMLKEVPFLKEALPVVLHHQERVDGSGYPAGLRGEEIPLSARIFAVADAYDAMTSRRPYRAAMSHAEAIEEIRRCSGTQFDPKVVEVFLSLFNGTN